MRKFVWKRRWRWRLRESEKVCVCGRERARRGKVWGINLSTEDNSKRYQQQQRQQWQQRHWKEDDWKENTKVEAKVFEHLGLHLFHPFFQSSTTSSDNLPPKKTLCLFSFETGDKFHFSSFDRRRLAPRLPLPPIFTPTTIFLNSQTKHANQL